MNISFAGEALEQVGDGRGWWLTFKKKWQLSRFLTLEFRLWAHTWPNCHREKMDKN
jgi:hypothetical protein